MRVDTKENSDKKKLKISYVLRIVTVCIIVILLIAIWIMIASMVNKSDELPTEVLVQEQDVEEERFEDAAEPIEVVSEEENAIVVWLDAGHGGKDVGSDVRNVYEKDINMDIVNKIVKELEDEEYEILLTRDDDTTVKLRDRVTIINDAKAYVMVSVHCNSVAENYVTGIETYYADGKRMGKKLAQYLQDATIEQTGAKDRGIEKGELVLLKYTNMPAALIEVGFLTNKAEYQNLTDSEYQDKLAKGIAEGIKKFINEELSE